MKRFLLGALLAFVPSLSAFGAAGHAQDTRQNRYRHGLFGPVCRSDDAKGQRHQALSQAARRQACRQNVEIIRKDVGGINPPVAKRLAQELVTRDNVDILAGFQLTPNALAGADVSAEAKKFMVIMNAATAIVTTKSPYMARVSFTIPQLNQTLGDLGGKSTG